MTSLDEEVVPEILEVIAEIGISATLTEKASTLTPSTGAVSGGGTTYTVTATPPTPYDQVLIDGVGIIAGDVQIYVNGPDTIGCTPLPGWRISIAGKDLFIVGVKEMPSGEQIAAFELHCRR